MKVDANAEEIRKAIGLIQEKQDFLDLLLQAWLQRPALRFGQLIMALSSKAGFYDPFYIENDTYIFIHYLLILLDNPQLI